MCIIIAKPKGVKLPSKEILKTCFINNPDGAGVMFTLNEQVHIHKGFMTYDALIKGLNKIKHTCKSDLTDKSIVIHFRIGTHGKNDRATCHPFPITSNYDDLRKTKVTNGLGIAHNGVISGYYYDEILSDTQAFVKDFLAPIKRVYKDFYKDADFKKIILKHAGTYNKFAILNKDDQLYILGDFQKDDAGVYYSNGTYKTSRVYYSSLWDTDGVYSYNYNTKTSTSTKTPQEEDEETTERYTWDNEGKLVQIGEHLKHTKSTFRSKED